MFKILLINIFVFFFMISYSQEITGDYYGRRGPDKEKLSIRADYSFVLISQFSDMVHEYSGKWSSNHDTLILNPFILPNDSIIEINQDYDSKINGILVRVSDILGHRERFNRLIVYLDSQEYYVQPDQNNDYIYNQNDYKLDSIAIYKSLSNSRFIIHLENGKNIIEVKTVRALQVNDIYNRKYVVLKKRLRPVYKNGLRLKRK